MFFWASQQWETVPWGMFSFMRILQSGRLRNFSFLLGVLSDGFSSTEVSFAVSIWRSITLGSRILFHFSIHQKWYVADLLGVMKFPTVCFSSDILGTYFKADLLTSATDNDFKATSMMDLSISSTGIKQHN